MFSTTNKRQRKRKRLGSAPSELFAHVLSNASRRRAVATSLAPRVNDASCDTTRGRAPAPRRAEFITRKSASGSSPEQLKLRSSIRTVVREEPQQRGEGRGTSADAQAGGTLLADWMGNCSARGPEGEGSGRFDMLVGAKLIGSGNEILASPLARPQAEERVDPGEGSSRGDLVEPGSSQAVDTSEPKQAEEEDKTSAVHLGVSRFVEVFRLQSGNSVNDTLTEARLSSRDDDEAAATTLSPPVRLSRDVLVGATGGSPCRRNSVVAKIRLFEELSASTKSEEDDGGVEVEEERTWKSVVFVTTLLSSIFLLLGSFGGIDFPFVGRRADRQAEHVKVPIVEDRPRRRKVNFGRYIDFKE
ncbi:hypothetical protein THAOC_33514 [Thalassiosira oceanica]|uniref:Uncharacterized protein n=1 Tax=Thalassiosira oceanica TaxID=159749 RepID=K0RM09_THAOC|nr:hypothetical protein THAOC_33514 [Thalassiosira oceanica]|eukprot:EJK47747.1 hypothetical protein THAOC_33514 [Thalassiosira oceanica]